VKLDDKLNIIIPIYGSDEETIIAYVHATPVSREVFEAHFMLISRTFSAVFAGGLGHVSGPRVASLVMRDIARRDGDEDGATAFMNEVRRLSSVLVRDKDGWTTMLLHEAIDKKRIGTDDVADVENALVFFIVVSAMHRRQMRRVLLDGAAGLWGAQISSSSCTELAASLRTSTATAAIGVTKARASSVPH
jgi:hypothetical protein